MPINARMKTHALFAFVCSVAIRDWANLLLLANRDRVCTFLREVLYVYGLISVHKSWRWCYHRRLKTESQMDNVCLTAHLYCCRPECFPWVINHYDYPYVQRYGINNQQHIVYMYFINEFKYASIKDWYEQSYTWVSHRLHHPVSNLVHPHQQHSV